MTTLAYLLGTIPFKGSPLQYHFPNVRTAKERLFYTPVHNQEHDFHTGYMMAHYIITETIMSILQQQTQDHLYWQGWAESLELLSQDGSALNFTVGLRVMRSVQFSSVQERIYACPKAHMHSTQSLRSFPIVFFGTVRIVRCHQAAPIPFNLILVATIDLVSGAHRKGLDGWFHSPCNCHLSACGLP